MLGIINSKRNTNLNPLSTSEINNESSTAFSSRTNTTAAVEPMENSILPVFTLQPPSVQQQEPDSLKSRPRRTSLVHRIRESFEGDVHTEEATLQLAAFCFMSGYIDAISFTACYIWCGFQTGNTVQLSLAVARLFSGPNAGPGFQKSDQQALVSLLTFAFGGLVGRLAYATRLGFAPKNRSWLFFGTLFQALFTLGGSLCAIYAHQSGFATLRGALSWTDPVGFCALAFMSASMGLQGVMATHFGSHFGNATVLTSVWINLCSDTTLFLRGRQKPRDHKVMGIFAVFLGGFAGRALADTVHPAATLGIASGLRVIIAFSWLIVGRRRKV